jgi:predicted pyridoxine 5'-phosphate oxidase superfamily flavin-nucleotide-binding protein
MGSPFEPFITPRQKEIIAAQKVFFVATAAAEGTINVSPRGHDCFRVLGDNEAAWIDYPGSGDETAKHLAADGRATLMFCDLEGRAHTVRLFGRGRAVAPDDPEFADLLARMGMENEPIIRRVFVVDVEMTSFSCGSGVPVYEFKDEGKLVEKWRQTHANGKFEPVMEHLRAMPRPADALEDLKKAKEASSAP